MPRVQTADPDSRDIHGWVRRIASIVNGILMGRTNNVFDQVTLTASATSTTISDDRITGDTVALLEPKTANAAGAVAGLYQTAEPGVITLHHASTAATDKHFRYALFG